MQRCDINAADAPAPAGQDTQAVEVAAASRTLYLSEQVGGDASHPQCFLRMEGDPRGKQPYAIARQDGQPVAFGGLREGFKWPDGTVLRTFTITTTNANETVSELRNRMPVILEQQDWPMWLGEVERDPATLLRPAGKDVLKVWPVSKQANSPRNYGRSCWRELGDGD
jgi:putative SOS response-associated peptidase YedK